MLDDPYVVAGGLLFNYYLPTLDVERRCPG